MKRIYIFVILCIHILMFAACTKQNTEKPIESIELTEAKSAATHEEIPVLASKYETLRELTNYITISIDDSCYTEESVQDFRSLAGAVSDKFNELDIDEALHYVYALKEAYENLKYKAGDMPRIYISTDGVKINQNDYISARVAVIDREGGLYPDVDMSVLIKVRGQSTAQAEKKPYTFRYEESKSLLGMDSGKRWVLLANAYDKSLLRNKLALDFSRTLNLAYTSDSEFVELWLNGEFKGNYLLTEPVTDGKNRININTEINDFLIELERDRNEDGIIYIKTKLFGVRFKIEKPEDAKSEQVDFLKSFISDMETALNTHNHFEYEKHIDIKSFVDYYIVLNYFKDVDAEYSSTNFYIKGGILYAGPPWDFDLSSGNVNPKHNNPLYWLYNNVRGYGSRSGESAEGIWGDFGWFGELLKDEYFQDAVEKRYLEINPQIINLYLDNELGKNQIDILVEENINSFLRNYNDAEWSLEEKYCDMERYPDREYTDNVEYLRIWLKTRNEWLLNYYKYE